MKDSTQNPKKKKKISLEAAVELIPSAQALIDKATDPDELISKQNFNVPKLIQEIKGKMHAHQKKVFEFLWQNIAQWNNHSWKKNPKQTVVIT